MTETIPTKDVQAVREELCELIRNTPPTSRMWDKLDAIDTKLVTLIVKSRSINPQTGNTLIQKLTGNNM